MKIRTIAVTLLIFLLALTANAQQLAFPTAEGFGRYSPGGRGGKIYEVTNLNDNGTGSLRAAVEVNEPRIAVFRISGTIELQSELKIDYPYITIAGQTAPGDGICLKNYQLRISTDHVIIRYMRFRLGDDEGAEQDSVWVDQGRNIIFDHCSTSWAVDETLSVAALAATPDVIGNVTVQWCMITEGLNHSLHEKGSHGYGSLVREGWNNGITYHHNLYAHNRGRNPRPGNYNSYVVDPCGLIFDFRNNVVYNWDSSSAGNNDDVNTITRMNFVGNYYRAGIDSDGNYAFKEKCKYSKAYFSGNWMNGTLPSDPWSLVNFIGFTDPNKATYKLSNPVPVAPVNTSDANTAYVLVLADAGASFPVRDSTDDRIVNDVINGTGGIIDCVDGNDYYFPNGYAQAATSNTITLESDASPYDDRYYGQEIEILSGTGSGQIRFISDYIAATNIAYVSPDWDVIPDFSSWYGVIVDCSKNAGGYPVLQSATPPDDTDHDGMPDDWELALCLDPNDANDGPDDRDGDGYTNIEEYLNWLPTGEPVPHSVIYVAPDGNDLNDGSIGSPFKTITKAHEVVVAGDTIFLRGGVHYYDEKISITKSGTSANPITMQNYQNETVILDFSEQPRGGSSNRAIQMSESANYWHLKGFTIRYAGSNGLYTNSSYNIFEQLVTHSNNDTGIQIRANASGSPAYNLVLNCDSYLNFDPANNGENADGFGAKGTTGGADSLGPGNVFRGCRAWNNSDDGWDFWWAGNGVTVEDCWSFRNGENIWGDPCFTGNGQGFKLGQGGGEHILIRCMSYNNQHKGFDLNRSTTDATGVTLYNCTGVLNLEDNFRFLNPSTGAIHVLRNNLSYLGSVTIGTLIDDASNSWNYYDDYGWTVTAADFVSLDSNFDPIVDPNDYNNTDSNGIDGPRGPDGGLPELQFLRLAPTSWLIDMGIDVGEPFEGYAPDLGAFEYGHTAICIFVDWDAGGANNGSSWEDAYTSLQDALAVAVAGENIAVAQGTYKPTQSSDRTATFQLINGVGLYGGYPTGGGTWAGRNPNTYQTILSGDIVEPNVNTDNSYHVLTGSGTDANTVIDGFIISAGNAASYPYNCGGGMYNNSGSPTVVNCTFIGNSATDCGGGMYNDSSSPTLTNCTFSGNSAVNSGGGMCNEYDSAPTVTNCTFTGNSATWGGGMYNYDSSSPTLTNCTFIGNSATWGGGMYNYDSSSPTLTNCTFIGNSAVNSGGGMCNEYDSAPTVTNCTFTGNSATWGGGMDNYTDSSWTMTNCTFSGNSADYGGGVFNVSAGIHIVTNCTFSGNWATTQGGGICYYNNSKPWLKNCILWGNTAPAGAQIYRSGPIPPPIVMFCDVQGGWAGTGNINADPMFAREPNNGGDGWGDDPCTPGVDESDNDDFGDLHLVPGFPGSPCINTGDPCGVYTGQTDIDGDSRVSNGRVDMGSDEVIWDGAENVAPADPPVILNPGGGLNDPNVEALVVFDNNSAGLAEITVVEMNTNPNPTAIGFKAFGKTLRIDTTLADGEFSITVVIPLNADDLSGIDPRDVDLMYYDGQAWLLAVTANTQTPPADNRHEDIDTAAPSLGQMVAFGLGHYGVYWNSSSQRGFVWANVDHCTDFSAAAFGLADFEPDGDVDFADFAEFALRWLDSNCHACSGADLSGDGDVDLDDLSRFADDWLAGV